MAALKVLFPTLNDMGAAGANTTKIQALLDAAGACEIVGDGIVWINAPLRIGSRTSLKLGPTTEIKQANGTNTNILVNKAYLTAWAGVTVAWSAGLVATVSWTAHGRAQDEYVWIRGTPGTTDPALIGVFKVLAVPDANTFTVTLRRVPAATGSGTMQAKVCNEDVGIEGGVWNHNDTGNSAATALDRHAIILAGIRNLRIINGKATDAEKFTLCLAAVRDFDVDGWHPFNTNSDGIKIYGPAFDGSVRNLSGDVHDDGISVQTREPAAFAAYDFTQGGDVLSVHISNVRISDGTTSAAVIYANPYFMTDDVTIDGVSYHGTGYAVRVDNNDPLAASAAGTIKLLNIEQVGTVTNTIAVLSTGGDFTIAKLEIEDFRSAQNPGTGTGIDVIRVEGGVIIKDLVLNGAALKTARNDFLVSFYGIAENIVIRDVECLASAEAFGRLLVCQTNSSVKKITVEGCDLNKMESVVQISSMSEVPHISFIHNHLRMGNGQAISLSSSATVYAAGNRATPLGLAGGFVRCNGAAIVVNVHSGGGNLIPSGKAIVKINGAETVNLFADDFEVDVTAVARVNGGRCFNTNAAAGTLGAAGPVDCMGTSANSWRRRGDYSLQY